MGLSPKLTPDLMNSILAEAPENCWIIVHATGLQILASGANTVDAVAKAEKAGFHVSDMILLWSPPRAQQKQETPPDQTKPQRS